MKVVFAMDSMKGCLTSLECGEAAAKGLVRAIPGAEYIVRPLADGGEGTVKAVTIGCEGEFVNLDVTGPLGRKVQAEYGIIYNDEGIKTAIIEIASAAGITLISDKEKDPFKTTTYGVGEIINDALSRGCRSFIIGLGGSATNDLGIGMLQALGVKFYDSTGTPVGKENSYLTGSDLEFIYSIDTNSMNPSIKESNFRIACDVNNPLTGENGASYIYGPQKGLFQSEIQMMDKWHEQFVATLSHKLGEEIDSSEPGMGAAGGLGFAFKHFLNGSLERGNKIVIEETNLLKYIKEADLVVTGEGTLDNQTPMGKAPVGIAKIAKEYGKPVISLVGAVAPAFDGDILPDVDAYFPILRRPETEEEAMDSAKATVNMSATSEQVFRLITNLIGYME